MKETAITLHTLAAMFWCLLSWRLFLIFLSQCNLEKISNVLWLRLSETCSQKLHPKLFHYRVEIKSSFDQSLEKNILRKLLQTHDGFAMQKADPEKTAEIWNAGTLQLKIFCTLKTIKFSYSLSWCCYIFFTNQNETITATVIGRSRPGNTAFHNTKQKQDCGGEKKKPVMI